MTQLQKRFLLSLLMTTLFTACSSDGGVKHFWEHTLGFGSEEKIGPRRAPRDNPKLTQLQAEYAAENNALVNTAPDVPVPQHASLYAPYAPSIAPNSPYPPLPPSPYTKMPLPGREMAAPTRVPEGYPPAYYPPHTSSAYPDASLNMPQPPVYAAPSYPVPSNAPTHMASKEPTLYQGPELVRSERRAASATSVPLKEIPKAVPVEPVLQKPLVAPTLKQLPSPALPSTAHTKPVEGTPWLKQPLQASSKASVNPKGDEIKKEHIPVRIPLETKPSSTSNTKGKIQKSTASKEQTKVKEKGDVKTIKTAPGKVTTPPQPTGKTVEGMPWLKKVPASKPKAPSVSSPSKPHSSLIEPTIAKPHSEPKLLANGKKFPDLHQVPPVPEAFSHKQERKETLQKMIQERDQKQQEIQPLTPAPSPVQSKKKIIPSSQSPTHEPTLAAPKQSENVNPVIPPSAVEKTIITKPLPLPTFPAPVAPLVPQEGKSPAEPTEVITSATEEAPVSSPYAERLQQMPKAMLETPHALPENSRSSYR